MTSRAGAELEALLAPSALYWGLLQAGSGDVAADRVADAIRAEQVHRLVSELPWGVPTFQAQTWWPK